MRIKAVEYERITAEEAVLLAVQKDSHQLNTILSLRDSDNVIVSIPFTISVDAKTAKQVVKKYLKSL